MTVVEDVAVDGAAVIEDEIEVEGIKSFSSSAWLSIDFLESNCKTMNPGCGVKTQTLGLLQSNR